MAHSLSAYSSPARPRLSQTCARRRLLWSPLPRYQAHCESVLSFSPSPSSPHTSLPASSCCLRPPSSAPYSTSNSSTAPPWRPAATLDEWVKKEARPISLKQLTFFGRTLTHERLLSSANYVREELPTRLAHRLRDMQTLPYVVVANQHVAHVYERYYAAFETFRRVPPVRTAEDNDAFCSVIEHMLEEHLTVIPSMTMGVLECQSYLTHEATDKFMNNMLRARISRRVIAEQHLALTRALKEQSVSGGKAGEGLRDDGSATSESGTPEPTFVGEVFLKCRAADIIERCARVMSKMSRQAFGKDARIPEVKLKGHLDATFPYIVSHLEYIVGELLRNSFSATFERHGGGKGEMPPIEVLIVEAPQHVILRFSDQGGGVPGEILPTLWTFGKGPRMQTHLENLSHVPKMAATMQELSPVGATVEKPLPDAGGAKGDSSLVGLASRPPNLRLGMGLPMSRVYAEYWAGSLSLQNLTGHGTDVFLQISKLGNKNEQLTTRASMDAL